MNDLEHPTLARIAVSTAKLYDAHPRIAHLIFRISLNLNQYLH